MTREVADRVERAITIPAGEASLDGNLTIPAGAKAIVLFAHGSGSSRSSPRNVWVAGRLQQAGLATLLFDLLTSSEDERDTYTRQHRFDIGLLAKRLAFATRWVDAQAELASLPVGYFGASTGAAAALVAASELGNRVGAVVSRGGRPDLAGDALAKVKSPTLLVVGGADDVVLDLNRRALALLGSEKRLEIVPGATHLFEEPGALERVANLAAEWLVEFLIVENAR
ncbi:MAG TPA: dienelactone hydrolase family protein [Casimicrobiaceae bacterium]|nr:dienelactone hydrolase family protein [Casimicrobiaceae bacterium]